MEINQWKIEDLTTREGYEALVTRLGGEKLESALEEQREARQRLDESLTPDQHPIWLNAAESAVEVAQQRETAAVRASLAYGVGIGAALASYPRQSAPLLVSSASEVVSALVGSELGPMIMHDLARTVLATLKRASVKHDNVKGNGVDDAEDALDGEPGDGEE